MTLKVTTPGYTTNLTLSIGIYNVSKHPDVISGKKRGSDILEDFLKTFESFSYYKVLCL